METLQSRFTNELLKEIKIRKLFIPGEHDWYLDMGKKYGELFGQPHWSFDHKGVRFIGLDTVSRAPDYWSMKKMSPIRVCVESSAANLLP